jgi:hypothetical protein
MCRSRVGAPSPRRSDGKTTKQERTPSQMAAQQKLVLLLRFGATARPIGSPTTTRSTTARTALVFAAAAAARTRSLSSAASSSSPSCVLRFRGGDNYSIRATPAAAAASIVPSTVSFKRSCQRVFCLRSTPVCDSLVPPRSTQRPHVVSLFVVAVDPSDAAAFFCCFVSPRSFPAFFLVVVVVCVSCWFSHVAWWMFFTQIRTMSSSSTSPAVKKFHCGTRQK